MSILGVGRHTAYELICSQKIKGIRIGKQIRIPKEKVREFLNEKN